MTSRVAKKPIPVPKNVEINFVDHVFTAKGPFGSCSETIPKNVSLVQSSDEDGGAVIQISPADKTVKANALAGTMRALVANAVLGVAKEYEVKLMLVGVGYRAKVEGSGLNLSLGFSHPVVFPIPQGISVAVPNQTEVVIKGINKQQVYQTAANVRKLRKPERYKGKGIRYSTETVKLKETKKK